MPLGEWLRSFANCDTRKREDELMKVFLAEYVCGGGFGNLSVDSIEDSLRLEGAAMASALAEDVAKVAELCVPVDPRLVPCLPDCEQHLIQPGESLWGQWARAAEGCDAAIVIAPEKDGILAKAVGMLRAANVDVIAGSGDFLRVASDKQQTARAFMAAGVPHPVTFLPTDPRSITRLRFCDRFIVKPRDGCGTESIALFDDLDRAMNSATDNDLIQGYVPGQAASVAVIVSGGEVVVLPAVSQDISIENCAYRGGQGPLDNDLQRRAAALAQCAIAAMPPSARGFVGLDLILGEDVGDDVVIEINPRLTTSYVGLRHMIAGNLGARLLGLECGPVQCKTGADEVRWTRDGQVWVGQAQVGQAQVGNV
jgi:predicted ATP-grasp superfamily ATP-dependent carboligase